MTETFPLLSKKSLPWRSWRFWVPLVLQTALIAAVPAQAVYTHLTGTTVVLKTVPVDPYDLLRGYSQTLAYDISRPDDLRSLPGWNTLPQTPVPGGKPALKDTELFVILEAPTPTNQGRPQPWKPVGVSRDRPSSLPSSQIALKGRVKNGWQIVYGLETYYMPENRREEVNKQVTRANQKQTGAVEIKVDTQGNAIPLSLWVENQKYEF
jgi:uncharacterized membrane-anchored protein